MTLTAMRAPIDIRQVPPPRVSLLLFIGPPSVGKSSAAQQVCHLLDDARVPYAYVDRDQFGTNGLLHEDPLLDLNEILHTRVAAGAQRLVVSWRVESGLELARLRAVLGWTEITVCRLRAEAATLSDRIAAGESSFQGLHLQAMALEIAPRLDAQVAEDILLATDATAPRAVAIRAYRQWTMQDEPAVALAGDAAA